MTFCSLAGSKGNFLSGLLFLFFKFYLTCNQQHLGRKKKKTGIKGGIKEYLGGKDSYFEAEHIESLDSFLASCDF